MRLDEARSVLGLEADDGPEEARKAYRKLALSEHPDKSTSDSATATANFQRIQDAYTRIQAAEESGRWDEEDWDDEDGDGMYGDELFEEMMSAMFFGFGGGGVRFGGGGRGMGGFGRSPFEEAAILTLDGVGGLQISFACTLQMLLTWWGT